MWPRPVDLSLTGQPTRACVADLGKVSRTRAFVSLNGWDIAGATDFGFRTVWVNRLGRPLEELGVRPTGVVGSLRELPAALSQGFDT